MGCDSWGHKELYTTERLNCTDLKHLEKKMGGGLEEKNLKKGTPESPLDCKEIKPVNTKGN